MFVSDKIAISFFSIVTNLIFSTFLYYCDQLLEYYFNQILDIHTP